MPPGSHAAHPAPNFDAEAAQEWKSVVLNNGTAALQWFNSPQVVDENGDTTVGVSV